MKKQSLMIALISSGLVACGGGGGGGSSSGNNAGPAQLTTPAANVLTVSGEGINKQETLTVDKKDFLISARGNQPIQLIEFYQKPENYDWYGRITLDSSNSKAQLEKLAFDNRNTAFLSCAPDGCPEGNSTYSLQHGTQQSMLSIHFDQEPNYYRQGGSSTVKAAKVSGDVLFGIPANWPILQDNRFPLAAVQGKLGWGGQQYSLSNIENISATRHELSLRGPRGLIYLTVEQRSATSFRLQLKDGTKSYSTDTFNATGILSPWQESGQQIKLDLGQLGVALFNDDHNVSEPARALTGTLTIPKAVFNLSVDGEVLNSNSIALVGGFAENDSKYYAIQIKQVNGNSGVITYAELRQELDGHLWLDYYDSEDSPSCGSPTSACVGLSLSSDKKTYQFNRVKLGSLTLNGSAYIPGVFE